MAQINESPDFEVLLQYLKRSRGFDFTGYKRPSLQRRVDKRMRAVDVRDYGQYVEYLEVHPDEFVALFNMILINVTGFFRDPSTWSYLREEVLPAHLDTLGPEAPIRVWSAGCSSGEEAYSLAIVLAEVLGQDAFKERAKIYGTDVDDEALQTARQATYTGEQLNGLPAELRERYFEDGGGRHTFRADLRRSVIFGRLDVLRDAPISRLELLSCRNTLMYLNAETQHQVLDRFHYALNTSGILMLGKAETLLSQSVHFEPIDRRRRIFRRVAGAPNAVRAVERRPILTSADERPGTLLGAAIDAAPTAALVVDRHGHLVHTNAKAREAFHLTARDIGQPFQDLAISYQPIELRTPIEQAYRERGRVVVEDADWSTPTGRRSLDFELTPLQAGDDIAGVLIVIIDRTQERELEERLRHANHELERAYEELQSTNEELETTNEELQSTIEELETTNEELQSTNEELETMNEELHSTNDELHMVNDEARVRADEVGELNHFLNAILTSLRDAVVVVGPDHNVRLWNAHATELWGLREEEVRGSNFFDLDTGLPVEQLRTNFERSLKNGANGTEVVVDAVTRRGKPVRCHVTMNALTGRDGHHGTIIVMEAEPA